MTIDRFRVTYEHDPILLWRDIVVGTDRTLDGFQTVLNHAVGLTQAHRWVSGTGPDDWDSAI